jgi:hypothetical protein
MKIYVTKYALTAGIKEHEAEISSSGGAYVNGLYGGFFGNDFWDNEEEAKKHANVMRLKKIASLKKQIEKLEKLTF